MRTDTLSEALLKLAEACLARHLRIGTAESCTGGSLAATMTSRSGASNWFHGGIVSYAVAVKEKLLSVPADLVQTRGPVSAPVAEAMARGAVRALGCDVALSVTGQAGPLPDGLSPEPVGTVYLGWADRLGRAGSVRLSLQGSRSEICRQAVAEALALALARVCAFEPGSSQPS